MGAVRIVHFSIRRRLLFGCRAEGERAIQSGGASTAAAAVANADRSRDLLDRVAETHVASEAGNGHGDGTEFVRHGLEKNQRFVVDYSSSRPLGPQVQPT